MEETRKYWKALQIIKILFFGTYVYTFAHINVVISLASPDIPVITYFYFTQCLRVWF